MPNYRIEIVDHYPGVLQITMDSCPVCADKMRQLSLDIKTTKDYGSIMLLKCKCETVWKFVKQ